MSLKWPPRFLFIFNLFPDTKSRGDPWKHFYPLNYCYGFLEHGIVSSLHISLAHECSLAQNAGSTSKLCLRAAA